MSGACALNSLQQQLKITRQRVLIWVSGDSKWCRAQLSGVLASCLHGEGVLIGEQPIASLTPVSARQASVVLGKTLDFAVLDAFSGFNPNAFGLICGAVSGRGCVLLLTPPVGEWPDFMDPEYTALCVEPYQPEQLEGHYLSHLVAILNRSDMLVRWTQGSEPEFPQALPPVKPVSPSPFPYRSPDQAKAVELIVQTAARRAQPLVLSADRGRGKSAALGLAAVQLLTAGVSVVLTAVNKSAVTAVQSRVDELAPLLSDQLIFRRPDELLHESPAADLLLVDEAAAIPTPVLLRLLESYPRAVFATTLHGYEGNGQGFALRFRQHLQQRFPLCHEFRLHTPIRWATPDPLEQLVNRMLLLDVDAKQPVGSWVDVEIDRVGQAELAADGELLRSLFGLLVLAHYRTTPGDLRIMLDSPNILIYVARCAGLPVACALLAREGPLPGVLAEAIWEGRRRPRGHLLPQTLIAQEGWQETAPWQGWRVVRIATHPSLQQQGIGRELLRRIEQDAKMHQVDYLGASFAANGALLRFWQDSGFVPLRVGEQRDPVAGTHALLVLKPLSNVAADWLPVAREGYQQSLLQRLPGGLQDLEAEHLPALLHGLDIPVPQTEDWRRRVLGFTDAQRTLESSLLPLTLLLHASIKDWNRLGVSVSDQYLLCERIIRQKPAAAVSAPAGKRAQLARLRILCKQLFSHCALE